MMCGAVTKLRNSRHLTNIGMREFVFFLAGVMHNGGGDALLSL